MSELKELKRELEASKAHLRELQVELVELHAEAWADGELTPGEAFELEQLSTIVKMAEAICDDIALKVREETPELTAHEAAHAVQQDKASAAGADDEAEAPAAVDQAQKEAASPQASRTLSGSVGKGGKNNPEDVTAVQELLNNNGASLTEDGLIGPNTIGAITKFQKDKLGAGQGLIEPGDEAWAALTGGGGGASEGEGESASGDFTPPTEANEPTLRKGDESADGWVEYLQNMLNHHLGVGTVAVNGKFDQATDKAVKEFQAAASCKVDGIVGNQTWSALREDKVLAEVGTDGRKKGESVETGAEARWGTESADILTYDENSDELRLVAMSVGDEPIDDFSADVFVNGARQTIKIGPPEIKSSTGAGHAHWVRVRKFAETHGTGPFKIEAYLPQDLGGDKWSGELDSVPGGGGGGGNDAEGFALTVSAVDDASAKPIPGVTVFVAGGPTGFSPLKAKTDDNGQVSFTGLEDATYILKAVLGKLSKSAEVAIAGADAKHLFQIKAPATTDDGTELLIRVVDIITGKPIEGAEVFIDAGSQGKARDWTDGKGESAIFLQDLPKVFVKASLPGESQSATLKLNKALVEHTFRLEQHADGGDTHKLFVEVRNKSDGEEIGAELEISGGPEGFKPVREEFSSRIVAFVKDGQYFASAKSDNDDQARMLTVAGEDLLHVFEMVEIGENPGGDLTVDVRNQHTGEPIAGAEVLFNDGKDKATEKTNADGQAIVAVPGGKDVTITVTAGKDSETQKFKTGNRDDTLFFQMNPLGGSGKSHKVSILVYEEKTKLPVPNATVKIVSVPPGFKDEGKTDNTGRTSFQAPDGGDYVIHAIVGQEDVSVVAQTLNKDTFKSIGMDEAPGKRPKNMVQLSIVVVDKDTDERLPDVDVTFEKGPDGFNGFTEATDSKGRVDYMVPANSAFSVTVAFGAASATEAVKLQNKDLILGIPLNIREVVTEETFILRVAVLDKAIGEPVEDAKVIVESRVDGFKTVQKQSDAQGEAELDGVKPGHYTAKATFGGIDASGSIEIVDRDDVLILSMELPVNDDDDDDDIEDEEQTLVVSVTASGIPDPIIGAEVTVSGGPAGFATVKKKTDDFGSVEFKSTPPGDYDIKVKTPQGVESSSKEKVSQGFNSVDFVMKLPIGEGDARLLVSVADTVFFNPIEGAQVEITGGPKGFTSKPLKTDSEGDVEIGGLADGDYTVKVSTKTDNQSRKVVINGGNVHETFELKTGEGGRLLIEVVDEKESEPIAGADVHVSGGPKGFEAISRKAGSDGKLEIKDLQDGVYLVKVSTENHELTQKGRVEGAAVPLFFTMDETGDTPPKVEGALLTIKTFQNDGKTPAKGVDMVLSGPGDFGTHAVESDEMGELPVLDCPDGDYVIKASVGSDKQTKNLRIMDGKDETVEFVMDVD